jgi:hypothetical protein
MPNVKRKYWLLILPLFFMALKSYSQGRTLIEFYSEVPAVSDFVLDIKPEMSAGVIVQTDGWKITPGQQVRVELPFIPPNTEITEVRLVFAWEGQVISGMFEGWSMDRFKYQVFAEPIYPHENQKRIFPSMLARSYEFRVRCNMSLRPDQPSLILQSLLIYWDTTVEKQ